MSDVAYYRCPVTGCGRTISAMRVADPGFYLLVDAHQNRHLAENALRRASELEATAVDAEREAAARRRVAGIIEESE